MRRYVKMAVVCLIAALACCTQPRQGDRRLAAADSLMFIRPDSSLKILDGIHDSGRMSRDDNALYALLLTQARYRNYLDLGGDSLIKIAIGHYGSSSDSVRKAWTYFYAAQVYRDMKDEKKTVFYFNRAEKAAPENEFLLRHYIFYHWGDAILERRPYSDALQKYKEAMRYAYELRDTFSLMATYSEEGISYLYMNKYREAANSFNVALKLAQIKREKNMLAIFETHLALTYKRWGKNDEALRHINEAMGLVRYADDSLKIYTMKGIIL